MTLFGYGKTTQAIAKKFGNCDIFDDKFTDVSVDNFGNRLLPSHLFDPENSSLEVTSPGIAPSHPLIKSAQNLVSEYDLFADNMPFSIWISGTNGKTTTTQMVQFLLEKRGSLVGGNIGNPLAELDPKAPIWVLETSSFTMHYTNRAKPNIYLLLPITPDHVTWHGSQEEYESAKLKPFASMAEGEMIIAPLKYANTSTDCFFVGYENSEDLAKFFEIDTTKIRFNGVFLFDAIMALAVTKTLFDEIDYDLINSFIIDGHRQEEFLDAKNRLWVDDSKATNLDATIEAIKNFMDKKIYLILGGDDKGQDLSLLFEFLNGKNIEIFAIGSNAQKLYLLSKEINSTCRHCGTLDVAVESISHKLQTGEVGLLSPAAASLDQFSSYKERGDKFKAFVKALS